MRAGILAFGMLLLVPSFAAADKVIDYSQSNARMNAAMAKGQATLSTFDAAMDRKDVDGLQINVRIPYGDTGLHEYLWLLNVRRNPDGSYDGTVTGDPLHLPNLQNGSPLHVARDTVADWIYHDAKGDHGGFTVRLMFEDMSPAERAASGFHFAD